MYERMVDDMDINCGDITQAVTIQSKDERFMNCPARRFGRGIEIRGAGSG